MKIPFIKYIINQIFSNKNIQNISEDLGKKHYFITTDEVNEVFKDVLETSSPAIRECLSNRQLLDIENDAHADVLRHYGIYDLYEYSNLGTVAIEDAPKTVKWFEGINWILEYEDVMALVNIFLFNEEPLLSISSVLQFKYKKKISVKALEMYQSIYWDTSLISGKEALRYCKSLRNSSYVVRRFADGELEVIHKEKKNPESSNGYEEPSYMMDTNYIKWKIGYKKDIEIPSTKDFLSSVKMDAMYKYQEALHMEKSIEVDTEEGVGFEGNTIDLTKTKRKNVEAERARLMKNYLDLFIKADDKMPDDNADEENFFKNLEQINMTFVNKEKIINIEERPDILDDIKGDM
jgi:hypothetical protein